MLNRLSFIETASWGVFKYTMDKNNFENIALWLVALATIKIDIAHQGEWGLDFSLSDKPSTRCMESGCRCARLGRRRLHNGL